MDSTVPVVPDRPPARVALRDRVLDWARWFGLGRLVASALSLIGVALAAFWLVRAPADRVEDGLPMATTTTSVAPQSTVAEGTTDVSAPPAEIVVHVAGAVVSPGVRRLGAGARVIDAIDAAGGLTPDAAADNVNLAAPLHDGDRVYVPRVPESGDVPAGVTPAPAPATPGHGAMPGPLALNTATSAQFEELPGIGPSLATAIVAHRDENGPFVTVEQLADVPGIGPAKLDALRELVTV